MFGSGVLIGMENYLLEKIRRGHCLVHTESVVVGVGVIMRSGVHPHIVVWAFQCRLMAIVGFGLFVYWPNEKYDGAHVLISILSQKELKNVEDS